MKEESQNRRPHGLVQDVRFAATPTATAAPAQPPKPPTMNLNVMLPQPHPSIAHALLTPLKDDDGNTVSIEAGELNPATTGALFAMEQGVDDPLIINDILRDCSSPECHLNPSQIGALKHACKMRLSLVQGPPGTGKTTTAVQLLTQMVRRGLAPLPILATSDSNVAVDNLLSGLAEHGINVVRAGRPKSIRQDLHSYS